MLSTLEYREAYKVVRRLEGSSKIVLQFENYEVV